MAAVHYSSNYGLFQFLQNFVPDCRSAQNRKRCQAIEGSEGYVIHTDLRSGSGLTRTQHAIAFVSIFEAIRFVGQMLRVIRQDNKASAVNRNTSYRFVE